MASTLIGDFTSPSPYAVPTDQPESANGDDFSMGDLEAELQRLAAVTHQLFEDIEGHDQRLAPDENEVEQGNLQEAGELQTLRQENAELRDRLQKLEADVAASRTPSDEGWLERQREYEMLLEEKSEVIRGLHQKMQDLQDAGAGNGSDRNTGAGQADEIQLLRQEMEEQRQQLEQDQNDVMAQLRQSELMMAKERAEMARQRQELARLQSDLAREIEMASRDPSLRDRLQYLRRPETVKVTMPPPSVPTPLPGVPATSDTPSHSDIQKNNSIFRRIFG
jgi:chromosome segregation ATPase